MPFERLEIIDHHGADLRPDRGMRGFSLYRDGVRLEIRDIFASTTSAKTRPAFFIIVEMEGVSVCYAASNIGKKILSRRDIISTETQVGSRRRNLARFSPALRQEPPFYSSELPCSQVRLKLLALVLTEEEKRFYLLHRHPPGPHDGYALPADVYDGRGGVLSAQFLD